MNEFGPTFAARVDGKRLLSKQDRVRNFMLSANSRFQTLEEIKSILEVRFGERFPAPSLSAFLRHLRKRTIRKLRARKATSRRSKRWALGIQITSISTRHWYSVRSWAAFRGTSVSTESYVPVSRGLRGHLPKLSGNAVKLYLELLLSATFSGPHKGQVATTFAELGRNLRMHRQTVFKAAQKLRPYFVQWEGAKNQYDTTIFTVQKYKSVKDFAVSRTTDGEVTASDLPVEKSLRRGDSEVTAPSAIDSSDSGLTVPKKLKKPEKETAASVASPSGGFGLEFSRDKSMRAPVISVTSGKSVARENKRKNLGVYRGHDRRVGSRRGRKTSPGPSAVPLLGGTTPEGSARMAASGSDTNSDTHFFG